MAIRFEDLVYILSTEDMDAVSRLEEEADELLIKEAKAHPNSKIFFINLRVPQHLRAEFISRYLEVGWTSVQIGSIHGDILFEKR